MKISNRIRHQGSPCETSGRGLPMEWLSMLSIRPSPSSPAARCSSLRFMALLVVPFLGFWSPRLRSLAFHLPLQHILRAWRKKENKERKKRWLRCWNMERAMGMWSGAALASGTSLVIDMPRSRPSRVKVCHPCPCCNANSFCGTTLWLPFVEQLRQGWLGSALLCPALRGVD